jgi:hypothetical protein
VYVYPYTFAYMCVYIEEEGGQRLVKGNHYRDLFSI